jgi:ubiquinone/menaquinone biosynthesis C-methylase UbiE
MDSGLRKLYRTRLGAEEIGKRNRLWRILCSDCFQKFIPEESAVLDIGAGYCEFINNIKAGRKYAVDLNEDTRAFANTDVEVFSCSAAQIDDLADNSIDVVFISNFLEHLKTKQEVLEVLLEIHRVCRLGGHVLILQPNIRYVNQQYWDFFDHHTPLSDRSLAEALKMTGFEIDKIYPRFLPYTTKSRLPQSSLFVKLYLKVPLVWHIIGQQAFVVARKHK